MGQLIEKFTKSGALVAAKGCLALWVRGDGRRAAMSSLRTGRLPRQRKWRADCRF
jgi:hypothetical protein